MRGVQMAGVGQVLNVAHRGIALHLVDVRDPFAVIAGLHARRQFLQHVAQIAHQRHVDFDDLVDLGGIDVDVNLHGLGRVGLHVPGHPIVKAHPEGQQQIGLLNRVIDPRFAVHAHHAEVERMSAPADCRCRAASAPRACWSSRRIPARRASRPLCSTPRPARITGRLALRIRLSAFSYSSGRACRSGR